MYREDKDRKNTRMMLNVTLAGTALAVSDWIVKDAFIKTYGVISIILIQEGTEYFMINNK